MPMSDGLGGAVILAVALAMDATAVAAARGVSGMPTRDAFKMATAFGAFQAGMAAVGWGIGASAVRWIASWDHWLAFGLLVVIGGKMLIEALGGDGDAPRDAAPLSHHVLLVLSVATSIDALAAGVTLPVLDAPEIVTVGLIGVATFVLTLGGAFGARWIGRRGGKLLDVLGGVTLIAIGIKTLVEHL